MPIEFRTQRLRLQPVAATVGLRLGFRFEGEREEGGLRLVCYSLARAAFEAR